MARSQSTYDDGRNMVALTKCFFCLDSGDLLLATRFTHDGKPVGNLGEMHGKVVNMHPCNKCEDMMKMGIMIITVKDGEFEGMEKAREEHRVWRDREFSDHRYKYRRPEDVPGFIPNPYRTGVVMVLKEEAFRRIFQDSMSTPGLIERIIRYRWSFMEDSVCELTGLFDHVDKPDEVPFRVECKKKGLDPHEHAVALARKAHAEEKAQAGATAAGKKEAGPQDEGGPAAGQDSPGGLPSVDADDQSGDG